MKKLQRQITLQVSGLHIREAEGEEESRVVEGYAAVFGVRSVNLVPWSSYREIYEIMEPGSITEELVKRSDVVFTAFHDDSFILGRSTNGKGTLTLIVDKKGLLCRCELAKTSRADEILTSIKRGDITGMSFAFTADEDDSENGVSYEREAEKSKDGKEVWIRHVKKCTGLYDVTVAGHPAYPQTNIGQREVEQREMDEFFDGKIGEPADAIEMRQRKEKENAWLREKARLEGMRRERELELEMMEELGF